MKKVLIVVLLLIVLSLLGGFYFLSKKVENLPPMDQAFMDKTTSSFMSSEKSSGDLKIAEYDFKNLEVVLYESDLKIRTKIEVSSSGITGLVDVSVYGYPWYEDRALYFIIDERYPPEFHDISLKGKYETKSGGKIDNLKNKFAKFKKSREDKKSESTFGKLLDQVPDLEEKFTPVAKEVINETVANISKQKKLMEKLAIEALVKGVNTFPVYKLGNSIPVSAAAVAIKEVKIENSILKIDLSFWNLALHLILMLVLGIGVFAYVIAGIRNPRLFEGLAALGGLSL